MKKILFIQTIILISCSLPAFSQNDTITSPLAAIDTLQEDIGLFTTDEILNLSLRFDITRYKWKKPKDEYLKAILTYHINDRDSINKEIRLKTRGDMRNQYCEFPPIKLNFITNDSVATDPKKITKLKMVTHCKYGNEEYLLKEYLIYKLYNVLTDLSFRVRLLKVNYINTHKKSKPIVAYAFLIEPEEMLAERTATVPVKMEDMSKTKLISEVIDRMAIFNYMIGNTDWAIANLHNCKVMRRLSSNDQIAGYTVPYDFDLSGLVNAHYAAPPPELGLGSVRERHYIWKCRSEDVFINALKEFSDNKDEFYRIINEFQLLRENTKKEMILYLDSFYSGFDKRNNIVYELLNQCKDL